MHVERTLKNVRDFLEPVWEQWHFESNSKPICASQNTCGRSSLFLKRVLEERGIKAEWQTGFFVVNGEHKSHSWVKTNHNIIDLTADQFGEAEILIADSNDPRYVLGTDRALPEFKAKRKQQVEKIWPLWLAQNPTNEEE